MSARLRIKVHHKDELHRIFQQGKFTCLEGFQAAEIVHVNVSIYFPWASNVTDVISFVQDWL